MTRQARATLEFKNRKYRIELRRPLKAELRRANGEPLHCQLIELSTGGCLVRFPLAAIRIQDLPELFGRIRFQIPMGDPPLVHEMRIRVIHARAAGSMGCVMGLEFLSQNVELLARYRRCLASFAVTGRGRLAGVKVAPPPAGHRLLL
jgi:PilZ domain-containing protein